ncbi:hypothetical protein BC832DRAFT_320046 [Gaertneriomyces semiglobifer]|nr:hypothetical protein BC832DRAFT_320046 [Gaertneriomyces semiglobifer]
MVLCTMPHHPLKLIIVLFAFIAFAHAQVERRCNSDSQCSDLISQNSVPYICRGCVRQFCIPSSEEALSFSCRDRLLTYVVPGSVFLVLMLCACVGSRLFRNWKKRRAPPEYTAELEDKLPAYSPPGVVAHDEIVLQVAGSSRDTVNNDDIRPMAGSSTHATPPAGRSIRFVYGP